MWRYEFPRLYELYEMSDPAHPENYFNAFERCYSSDRDGTRRSFGPLEKALERIDTEAWRQLLEKALPSITQKDPRRGWHQLFNSLYEAFGYELLSDRGYTSIQFIDRGYKRTPDLLGKSQTSTAILEVKTISCSEKEIDMAAVRPPEVFTIAPELSPEFTNKLLHDIKNAQNQLAMFNEPTDKKIVLLVFYMDCDNWGKDTIEAVRKFARLQQTADVEVAVRPLVIF